MRINPIQFYNYGIQKKTNKISFCSSDNVSQTEQKLERGQFLCDGIIHNFQHTSYARGDIDWDNFGQYLKEKYKNDDPNVFVFACSTGEEAYTMALLLNKIFPDRKIKIKAMDISENAIKECEKLKESAEIPYRYVLYLGSELNLSEDEKQNSFQKITYEDYKFQPQILDMVEFEKRNILEYPFKKYSDKPTIVMMRNMWFYVKEDEHKPFVNNLYKALAPNSIVVIGNVDSLCSSMHRKLLSTGFKYPLENANEKNKLRIFEKR